MPGMAVYDRRIPQTPQSVDDYRICLHRPLRIVQSSTEFPLSSTSCGIIFNCIKEPECENIPVLLNYA